MAEKSIYKDEYKAALQVLRTLRKIMPAVARDPARSSRRPQGSKIILHAGPCGAQRHDD